MIQGAAPRIELIGAASGLAEAQEQMQNLTVDVLLLDFQGLSPETLGPLQAWPETRVVILAGDAEPSVLDSAVLAGVRGIVRMNDPVTNLLRAVERVHDGELWIDRAAPGRIFMHMARQNAARANDPERAKIATLTSRERQTIIAVIGDAAAPGKVIASRLCISEHTLRNHLSSIYSKLGLSNRLDLFAYASRHSLEP
jgi:DNA-binding NarL/FixJ family response regulator